jgi:hypothetical protein
MKDSGKPSKSSNVHYNPLLWPQFEPLALQLMNAVRMLAASPQLSMHMQSVRSGR